MGVGAVSFFKVAFGIVNPDLVRKRVADKVEEVEKAVDGQREVARNYDKKRQEEVAALHLEAMARAMVAKKLAKTMRLRMEHDLCGRIFWVWRGVAAIIIEKRRQAAAAILNRLVRLPPAQAELKKRREDEAARIRREMQKAALMMQKVWRGWVDRRFFGERKKILTAAALRIQRTYRGAVTRREVAILRVAIRAAVTAIASQFRGRRARTFAFIACVLCRNRIDCIFTLHRLRSCRSTLPKPARSSLGQYRGCGFEALGRAPALQGFAAPTRSTAYPDGVSRFPRAQALA